MSNYWKKKLEELEKSKSKTNYWQNKMTELEKENKKKQEAPADIAPVGDDLPGQSLLGNSQFSPVQSDVYGPMRQNMLASQMLTPQTADKKTGNSTEEIYQYSKARVAEIDERMKEIAFNDNSSNFTSVISRLKDEKIASELQELSSEREELSAYIDMYQKTNGDFGAWLGNASMSGLGQFNKLLTGTADLFLGKPLQALGWENNPISSVADYYSDSYDYYKGRATEEAQKLGDGYVIAGELVEGTVAALPQAILAWMTGGGSLAATGGTAASTSLATKAAYNASNALGKAGMTVEAMLKNPQYWMSFSQVYGSEYEQAVAAGVDEKVAVFTSLFSSLLNAGVEIGINGGSGIQGLPSKVAAGDKAAIKSWVESSLEEGGEEILQGFISRITNKIVGGDETVLDLQKMLEEGAMGTAVGGFLGLGQIAATGALNAVANKETPNEAEKTVIDKEVERLIAEKEEKGEEVTKKDKAEIEKRVKSDLEKGYITTDRIEEILGGEEYTTYKDTVESEEALVKEYDELSEIPRYQMTPKQERRLAELESQIEDARNKTKSNQLKAKFDESIYDRIKNSRLTESYAEQARRGQYFEADLDEYTDPNARQTIKNFIDGKKMNNTRPAHEIADLMAKTAERTGAPIDVKTAQEISEAGFGVDGATVNGYVTPDGKLTVNIESSKAINSIVGHEVTHILEKTKHYDALQEIAEKYAKSKGEYDTRLDAIRKLYEGKQGYETDFENKIRRELTADLVGDYLFTDEAFVEHLAGKNRNVFQKIYDEIKYYCKIAVAGSEQARQLEKVKRNFDRAWDKVKNNKGSGETQMSLSETGKNANGEYAPTFYSQMAKVAEGIKGEKIGADSVVNYLTGKGVKAEEIKWSGIEEFLEGKKSVTKTELMEFIAGSQLQIEEKVITEDGTNPQIEMKRKNRKTKELYVNGKLVEVFSVDKDGALYPSTDETGFFLDEESAMASYADQYSDKTKWGGYKLDGGKNYRELLFKIPNSNYSNSAMSTHWGDKTTGVLAHARIQDMDVNGQKMLFVEEVQSDWHNKGNKKGYSGDSRLAKLHELGRQMYETRMDLSDKKRSKKVEQLNKEYRKLAAELEADGVAPNTAPDAPFSKNYHEYVMKRIVRIAAENGYDSVGWTPSDAQMERWNPKRQTNAEMGVKDAKNPDAIAFEEAYKNLYDKNIRKFLDKFGKKFGTEIGVATLKNGTEVWTMPITEEMKQSVLHEGQPLYSLSQDSTGKELSAEQQEYFKDSKARDENGNLQVVYHGSKNNGFNVFQYSKDNQTGTDYGEAFYFTSDLQKATGYSYDVTKDTRVAQYQKEKDALIKKFLETNSEEDRNAALNYRLDGKSLDDLMNDEGYHTEGGEVKKVYLNLTNPLIVDAGGKYYYEVYQEYFDQARENGNDGIIVKNVIDNPRGEARPIDTYIAFSQEQIKSVDNTNPTADPDIRYSLSADSEGRELSPAVKSRFANSKVVDENGDLKVVYHGTATGEFTIFDKSKGSVEGDFGSGFYFTDSEYDVSNNYEDGGPDFDNKVARRAEQIEIEEDIDYYEAEQRAREELYKGGHKFEVYLNIENPAIVGKTTLFTPESYFEQYNEEDYDSYEDYEADVDQLLADDIDGIIWEIQKNVDVNDTDGIASVLYEAVTDGGIGIEELKQRINNLYLEDSEGNLVANEVTRQIIESLGYDGIIDSTVSTKWRNMAMDSDTTHYIVFKPNQIKAVTNENPTDNADIHKSLSPEGKTKQYGNYNVSGKDIAMPTQETTQEELAPVQDSVQPTVTEDDFAPANFDDVNAMAEDSFAQITDEDAPMERETYNDQMADTTALDKNALKRVSDSVRDMLVLNNRETKAVQEVVQKYSTTDMPSRDALAAELRDKFGERTWVERNEELAEVKKDIRNEPIAVSDHIKSEYPEWGAWMRKQFGKVKFRNDGLPVDTAYKELQEMHPDMFPADIINEADQLNRIVEVANMDVNIDNSYELSDEEIYETADTIIREVGKYKEGLLQRNVEAESRDANWSLRGVDPLADETTDIFDETVEAPVVENKPIQTVPERLAAKLQNAETELAKNKQLRQESWVLFGEKIESLKTEYNSKANKNTKAANEILQRIENLRRRRADIDADYAKRISDMEAKVETAREEVEAGDSPTEQRVFRTELHGRIIDDFKNNFAENGYDFDKVLSEAKSPSALKAADNTPQRLMDKTFGYKEGHILSDLTVNKVAENETKAIQWLNEITGRKNGLLAKLSKQYDIKPRSKESAAAQMYAEGFYENENGEKVAYGDAELAQDFPNAKVQENIKRLANDPRIREFYDSALAQINEARVRNGYPAIKPLDNYFLHFREQSDFFSKFGIPFNPNDTKAKDLPTDINGVTADFKPGQPFFASAMHRKGWRTTYDILGGVEKYAVGASRQIFHIDDIQNLRALRNYIADGFGQAKGLEGLDEMDSSEVKDHIQKVFNNHLSNFAAFLNEEANVIAGKTPLIDRGVEGIFGRKGLAILGSINRQTGANQVGFNVSSANTNWLPVVQAYAQLNPVDSVVGLSQFATNKIKSIVGKGDGFAETSPVAIRRRGADRFSRTAWDKTADAGYAFMSGVDNVATELIARAKYHELTRKGMDEQTAHKETDKWVSRLMADRSLGQMPLAYNSKTLGIFLKYQLEVRNQLDNQFYDTIKEANASTEDIENGLARNATKAAKITGTLFSLALAQHVFGQGFESVAGYNPAFDIISVISKALGLDDDEDDEDTALDNMGQAFKELLDDLPYTSTFTGGRVPMSAMTTEPLTELLTGEDEYGNEVSRLGSIAETLPYYLMPTGYGQAKKALSGLGMFSDDHPVAGSYTDSGNLRFPVEDNLWSRLQAGLFGQYANENAREYFDEGYAPLAEKQIEEYIDLDLPIGDYRKYRDGLSGLKTTEEKLDYINSLDLPIDKKNIMANNVTDRKDPVDMTDYDDYGSLEEFDFATKNPEKYDFFQNNGISYYDYKNADEDGKRAYTWAYENPDKLPLAKSVAGDIIQYRKYTSDLYDIKADKDEYGESISGSAKEKKWNYINGLDLDYGQKIILFRSLYDSKADRAELDGDIFKYLESRSDISWEDEKAILEALDFDVYEENGEWYVDW